MDEAELRRFITERFADVHVEEHPQGGTFFFHGPERMFPFATIVTSDAFDQASNLGRPGVFRLNVGVSKVTFEALFAGRVDHDPTALDELFPHPVYGMMFWVAVLNPSSATFERRVRALLAEAYEAQAAKNARRAARDGG